MPISAKLFLHKAKETMQIALKEAAETEYWLEILTETDYIGKLESESIKNDCIELIKLLQSPGKTSKSTE